VNPTRSQNKTEMTLRSSRPGTTLDGSSVVPQAMQNLAISGFSSPHDLQRIRGA
jgi:hypothetical protein